MKPFARYSSILASATLLSALAACGGSAEDVPPGNSSNIIGDAEPATATQGVVRSDDDDATAQQGIGADGGERTTGQGTQNTQGLAEGGAAGQAGASNSTLLTQEDVLPSEYTREGAEPPARMATAIIQPTRGNRVSGVVVFIQESEGDERIRVVGKLVGIPEGQHGIHLHEFGDCTAPDAASAGEHYNPDGTMHGAPDAAVRHVGDFGNLGAAADATASFDFYDEKIALTGTNSVVNKAFIVHAGADDLTTQPSGDAGDRIACGIVNPQEFNTTPGLSGRGKG
ncbi:MAG: hypothetical protein RLZZ227_163 [Pseudomonadota bacterium]|jgi:Cu-Zn family superoxide dismutase